MSRKRKQEPVVEEILAEGSGPHAVADASEAVPTLELVADLDPSEPVAAELVADEMLADAEAEPLAEGDLADAELAEGVEIGAATMPTSAGSMDAVQLKQLIEALVFASDRPITVLRLRQLTRVSDIKRLEETLAEITADYEHRGLVLQQVSGGYQFRTRPQFSAWVQQLIQGRPVRLSRAQLETLAIIAYRQPITRPEIDDIRGVDSSATLKLLLDRTLIRMLGKKEEVGRPILYGTTKEFLDFFSLGDLRELPTLREYSELSEESRKVMTNRLGDADGGEGEGGGDGGEGGGTPDDGGFGGDSGGPLDGGEIADASALSSAASELLVEEMLADAVPGERFADGTGEMAAQLEPIESTELPQVSPILVDAMPDSMIDDGPAQLGDPPDPAQD